MILVTVGTQLSFDRLIREMDRLAPSLDQPIFAQIGNSQFVPQNMAWQAHVDATEFEERFHEAALVVAHAGIGTVLMAQRHCKPLILFPRRSALGEHRNDHQIATVQALAGRPGIYIAQGVDELLAILSQPLSPPEPGRPTASDRLNSAVRDFIEKR